MGCQKIFRGFFIILCLYLFLMYNNNSVNASANNPDTHHRVRNKFVGIPARPINQYARLKPIENLNDFLVDDDDFFELLKRQPSDDYGHLRFGKRGEEQFDDYGHMRFGRSEK